VAAGDRCDVNSINLNIYLRLCSIYFSTFKITTKTWKSVHLVHLSRQLVAFCLSTKWINRRVQRVNSVPILTFYTNSSDSNLNVIKSFWNYTVVFGFRTWKSRKIRFSSHCVILFISLSAFFHNPFFVNLSVCVAHFNAIVLGISLIVKYSFMLTFYKNFN